MKSRLLRFRQVLRKMLFLQFQAECLFGKYWDPDLVWLSQKWYRCIPWTWYSGIPWRFCRSAWVLFEWLLQGCDFFHCHEMLLSEDCEHLFGVGFFLYGFFYLFNNFSNLFFKNRYEDIKFIIKIEINCAICYFCFFGDIRYPCIEETFLAKTLVAAAIIFPCLSTVFIANKAGYNLTGRLSEWLFIHLISS